MEERLEPGEEPLQRVPGNRWLPYLVLAALVALIVTMVAEPWDGRDGGTTVPSPLPAALASAAASAAHGGGPTPPPPASPPLSPGAPTGRPVWPRPSADPPAVALPIALTVLDMGQFEAALASGEFVGATVLVEGRILDEPGRGRWSCHQRAYLCPYGLLQGLEAGSGQRPLIVQARYTARPPTREERNAGWPTSWLWRPPPSLPVGGLLVLRIHGRYSVEYLGQPLAPPGGGGLVWPTDALAALDRAQVPSATVLLAEGRLDLRAGADPACEHDEWAAELPDLRCGTDVWLVSTEAAGGSGGFPPATLQLQPDAQLDVAGGRQADPPQADPPGSVFALAPRLWRGCPDVGECWRWQALGLLAAQGDLLMIAPP